MGLMIAWDYGGAENSEPEHDIRPNPLRTPV